jgi:hypothetical protein
MAVALATGITSDVEGVSAGMEVLETRPCCAAKAADAVRGFAARVRATWSAPRRTAAGTVGASAIRATRITGRPFAARTRGVFHVLAHRTSLLLPRLAHSTRALNLARGTPGGWP